MIIHNKDSDRLICIPKNDADLCISVRTAFALKLFHQQFLVMVIKEAITLTSIPCPLNSQDCCGHCVKTHCVDDGNVFSLGERWESEGDECYEYSCELRNDLPTILAVKKECPFFDPECPEEEIMLDESGCCKLCNVTLLPKSESGS